MNRTPSEVGARAGCHLRFGPTLNNQSKGIRFAADYAVGTFAP